MQSLYCAISGLSVTDFFDPVTVTVPGETCFRILYPGQSPSGEARHNEEILPQPKFDTLSPFLYLKSRKLPRIK